MNKVDSLRELLAKVEAGEAVDVGTVNRALMTNKIKDLGFPLRRLVQWIMDPDDIRGMGAAKALHEAVLGEFCWDAKHVIRDGIRSHQYFIRHGYNCQWSESTNPARAWLIAILKALIAIEENL